MSAPVISFADLSDDQLIGHAKRLAAAECSATAALVRCLIELDTRRLYLAEGCSSLFTYCTQVLHLAEGAAYNRIEAARAAHRFPAILPALEDGSLTLTAVRLLAPHLTRDNHPGVLASARCKTKHEIERLVASLHPRPDAPAVIRKLPERRTAARDPVLPTPPLPAVPVPRAVASEIVRPAARPVATVAPLTPERYKVQITISQETHETLRRVQALMRHTIPSGDPAEIFDRALTLLLSDLERRRCAAATSPRDSRPSSPGSRHIPAAVKRDVWRRDGGRCAFVGRHGRCTERGFLEYHHVHPHAAGGASTPENIQLRCRAHNVYEAALFWPDDAVASVGDR